MLLLPASARGQPQIPEFWLWQVSHMNASHTYRFPAARILTRDIFRQAKQKHHIAAMVEADVTDALARIRSMKKSGAPVSFSAWLIKVIAVTVTLHREAAAFLNGKRSIRVFDSIHVSLIAEKEVDGKKIPVPLLIKDVEKKTIPEISTEIGLAKGKKLADNRVVLHRKTTFWERVYLLLPAFIRRLFWKYMLSRPEIAFNKMGNISFTSVGMMGQVNGWFIPASVHPLAFGLGAILKKPVVRNEKMEIREILNMTILLDHDVMDGAPMARFVATLLENINKGECL